MTCPLTVLVLMKNEENTLDRCLSSIIPLEAEIIVVDTGSTDQSIAIARKFTDRIYYFKWCDDFSAARNYALDQASGDWIFVLDGDEELAHDSQAALLHCLKNPDIDAYTLQVLEFYENDQLFWPPSETTLRLFRNLPGHRYQGTIYEEISIAPGARMENAEGIRVFHYGRQGGNLFDKSIRNLRILNQALASQPDNLSLYFHMGIESYRLGQFHNACEYLRSLWPFLDKQDAYTPQLIACLVLSLHLQGFSARALELLDKYGLPVFPGREDFYYLKGIICREQGSYAQAYQAFSQMMPADGEPPGYGSIFQQKRDMIYHFMGNLSEYFIDYETALEHYFRSLKENPRLLISLKRMINILNPRVHPAYTIEALSRVFDLSDPALQADLAAIFFEEGAYRLALGCLENLGSSLLSNRLRLLQGRCLLLEKRYDEAEQSLLQTAHDCQFGTESRHILALVYWWRGKNPQIRDIIRQMRNNGDEAGAAVITCLVEGPISPTKFKVQTGQRELAREMIHLLTGFADEASVVQAWTRLELWLGPRPSRWLAELFQKHGRFQPAEHEFMRCLEAGQDDALTYYHLVECCRSMNQMIRAAQYMKNVLEKGLDTPKIRMETARLYQEAAVSILVSGLEHFPDAGILDKALQKALVSLVDL